MSASEDYPKFPLMNALYGNRSHVIPQQEALDLDETITDTLSTIAAELHTANLIAFYAIHPQSQLREEIEGGLWP